MASDLPIIFDRFKLDPASGQLYGGGSAISLTPKALSVPRISRRAARPPDPEWRRWPHNGEVLVTRTVVDLVAGSRLQFTDRGVHKLAKGQKSWRVYAAREE